jgi:hypothetical protein
VRCGADVAFCPLAQRHRPFLRFGSVTSIHPSIHPTNHPPHIVYLPSQCSALACARTHPHSPSVGQYPSPTCQVVSDVTLPTSALRLVWPGCHSAPRWLSACSRTQFCQLPLSHLAFAWPLDQRAAFAWDRRFLEVAAAQITGPVHSRGLLTNPGLCWAGRSVTTTISSPALGSSACTIHCPPNHTPLQTLLYVPTGFSTGALFPPSPPFMLPPKSLPTWSYDLTQFLFSACSRSLPHHPGILPLFSLVLVWFLFYFLSLVPVLALHACMREPLLIARALASLFARRSSGPHFFFLHLCFYCFVSLPCRAVSFRFLSPLTNQFSSPSTDICQWLRALASITTAAVSVSVSVARPVQFQQLLIVASSAALRPARPHPRGRH